MRLQRKLITTHPVEDMRLQYRLIIIHHAAEEEAILHVEGVGILHAVAEVHLVVVEVEEAAVVEAERYSLESIYQIIINGLKIFSLILLIEFKSALFS